MLSFLFRTREHLWRNPFTGDYFDPLVLHDAVQGKKDTGELREPLFMLAKVTRDGAGWAETQVRDAYLDFLAYLEKKGLTASDSPTAVPSTG